jgi:outer membrane lipoprotein-sorting protein
MSLIQKGIVCRMPVLRAATGAGLAIVLLAAAAGTAWAGPKEDLKAVSVKFLALRSYHVVMENSDKRMPKTEMDFVAPDRYRMQMPSMGTQIVIGDTMYMSIDGRSMRIPMPKGTMTQWRETDRAMREVDKAQVEALGSEVVNGKPAKKYRMTQTSGGTPTTTLMWVGADGYPVRIETTGKASGRSSTVTITYSRFNDPSIRIDVPK